MKTKIIPVSKECFYNVTTKSLYKSDSIESVDQLLLPSYISSEEDRNYLISLLNPVEVIMVGEIEIFGVFLFIPKPNDFSICHKDDSYMLEYDTEPLNALQSYIVNHQLFGLTDDKKFEYMTDLFHTAETCYKLYKFNVGYTTKMHDIRYNGGKLGHYRVFIIGLFCVVFDNENNVLAICALLSATNDVLIIDNVLVAYNVTFIKLKFLIGK